MFNRNRSKSFQSILAIVESWKTYKFGKKDAIKIILTAQEFLHMRSNLLSQSTTLGKSLTSVHKLCSPGEN